MTKRLFICDVAALTAVLGGHFCAASRARYAGCKQPDALGEVYLHRDIVAKWDLYAHELERSASAAGLKLHLLRPEETVSIGHLLQVEGVEVPEALLGEREVYRLPMIGLETLRADDYLIAA